MYGLVAGKGGPKLTEVPKPEHYSYAIKPGEGTVRLEADPAMPISALIGTLTLAAGKPVVDQTGLSGYYKIEMEWTRDPSDRNFSGMLSGLSKLGLKLESQKAMFDVMVVDNALMEPTAN